jgi:hypothetical protein
MRKIKQMAAHLSALAARNSEELSAPLFDYLFYSPKLPLRQHQQSLLNLARSEQVEVFDEYFEKKILKMNVFVWGQGDEIILLTHGWASKAADFSELVDSLMQNPAYTIIAFDAPGNGSSEGGLTNLMLYVGTIYKIVERYGYPTTIVGHSLGAMANIIAYKNLEKKPKTLISLAPLIQLDNYFRTEMAQINIPNAFIDQFFIDFLRYFNVEAGAFDLNKLYSYTCENHWLFFDDNDKISPYKLTEDFLNRKKDIKAKLFKEAGHQNMIKNKQVITEIVNLIR